MSPKHIAVAAVTAAALWPVAAAAQDYSVGAAEFMNSCASCHGPAAEGDGVMAGFLTKSPPDLTQLQKNNGGIFPVARVFQIIDGTASAGVHGTRDMPAWGQRYSMQAPEMLGYDYSAADRGAFVRGRILALVEYLSTLQAE